LLLLRHDLKKDDFHSAIASGSLDQMSQVIAACGPDFIVLSGDDNVTLPLMAVGGRGVISVIANLVPRDTADMVHAALEHSAASLGLDPLPADQTTHPSLPLSGNGHHGEASEPSFAPPLYESTQAFSQDDDLIMERAVAQPEEPSTSASLASSGIAFHVRMPAKTFRPPEETPPASPSIAISPHAAAEETDILEVQPEMVAQPAAAEQADNVLGEEPAQLASGQALDPGRPLAARTAGVPVRQITGDLITGDLITGEQVLAEQFELARRHVRRRLKQPGDREGGERLA